MERIESEKRKLITNILMTNFFPPSLFLCRLFCLQVSCAQAAVQELRGRALAGRKLQVDFASRECQAHFFELVEREPRGGGGGAASAPVHRMPSLAGSAVTTPTSTRVVRTPSCSSSRSSTHSKERTGSSSSRLPSSSIQSTDNWYNSFESDVYCLELFRNSIIYRCNSS